MSSIIKSDSVGAIKLLAREFGVNADLYPDGIIRWQEDFAHDPKILEQFYEQLWGLKDAFLDLGYELVIGMDDEVFAGQLDPVGYGMKTFKVKSSSN